MDKLSVKGSDISLQLTGGKKAGSRVGDVSDDFRTLLQGKQENNQSSKDSKEVSKDTKDVKDSKDTKPTKDSTSDDAGKDAVSEDQGKVEKTEDTQTEGMLAAYQISQGMRPEMIQIVPETEAAAEVISPDVENMVQTTELEETMAVQAANVKVTQNLQTDENPGQADMTADGLAATESVDSQPIVQTHASETRQETSDFSSQLKNKSKTTQSEEVQTTSETTMAEHVAAAMTETPRVEQTEAPKYENVTTVHVEQPEELPEKVTDQLLSKLAEGINEFEIHIEPANLGKLAIKVLYEGNQATISIICSEKRAWEALGQNAKEIGNIIDRNLGEETTIIVEKQEPDYLNQTRDENEQAGQEQQKQKENGKNQDGEDAEQFLQKLRLGLAG